MRHLLVSLFLIVLFISCKHEAPVVVEYDSTPYHLANDHYPSPQSDVILTEQKVALGKMLFFEKALSGDNSMSCSSCHNQADAFSDTTQFSIGIQGLPGARQAMAIFNMAWNSDHFFWDGRASTLKEQALLPIQDELEMDESLENVVAKLESMPEYVDQFKRAFDADRIDSDLIGQALEQFMLSIVSHDSKYDRYFKGQEVLTDSEERGRQLFFAEYNPFFPELSGADCAHCHSGLNFSNSEMMNNGLDSDENMTDLGYFNVTNDDLDKGKFKVPSLRNIEYTFPYMHDGRFQTLEEVIEHYNEGIQASSTTDPTVANTIETGLFLDEQDIQDIIAFLKTLNDDTFLSNPEYGL